MIDKFCQQKEDNECCMHMLNINVLKISDLFGTKIEAECFVKCRIPNISEIGKITLLLVKTDKNCMVF